MTASGDEHSHETTPSLSESAITPLPQRASDQNGNPSSAPLAIIPPHAISSQSSRVSLASAYSSPSAATMSVQISPDGIRPTPALSSSFSSTFALPESSLLSNLPTSPQMMGPNTMAEAVGLSRGTGLMRRLSRGATTKIIRRRPSATSQHRDTSVGPAIMRRRSDSTTKGVPDSGVDVSDLDLDSHDDDAVEDLNDGFFPRSQRAQRYPNLPNGSSSSMLSPQSSFGSLDSGTAPTFPLPLRQGMWLTKITKKKRKNLLFRFDFEAGKIVWNPHKPSKQIYIDDIQDLRVATDAQEYLDQFQVPPESAKRWITVVYTDPNSSKGRNLKTMHIICPDEYSRRLWADTINRVQKMRIRTMTDLVKGGERSIKEIWRRETKGDPTAQLDFQAAKQLCRKLDINCSGDTLKRHFDSADTESNARLDYAHFENFVRSMLERQDIKQIYNAIRQPGNPELDEESFMAFLKDSQGIDWASKPEYWTNVFETLAKRCRPKGATSPIANEYKAYTMNFAAFQDLMTRTSLGKGINTSRTETKFDRPFNEYFISSSHNTYLLGRQVAGQSSTEAYISALTRGCRCIEIDCWDGSDGRPIVVHGRTLTSSVPFSDCIKIVNDYAFEATDYPLIISLEVHCNAEQQAIMTDIMKTVFGDQLVLQPLDPTSEVLPSPDELKHKILVKVKAAKTNNDVVQGPPVTRRPRGLSSPFSRPANVDNSTIPYVDSLAHSGSITSPTNGSMWSVSKTSITSGTSMPISPTSSAEDSDYTSEKRPRTKKKTTSNIVKVLGELGVYTQGIKFSDFRSPEARTFNHIYSFAERTFESICGRDHEAKIASEKHNRKYLMRVYPSGHRINSTNPEPLRFWRRGVQMVALNWQTYDLGMQLNEAMFAAGNDQHGYVLKPEEMRIVGGSAVFDIPPKKVKKRVVFHVDVLSAQQLPRPRDISLESHMNPYIEVEVHTAEDKAPGVAMGEGGTDASARDGLFGIGSPVRKRTRIVLNNGYDPHFNEEMKFTVETKYPSLVFVRWTVWNSPDGQSLSSGNIPLASYTAKLDSLQQGFRHIPLKNANSEQFYFSTLFCKFKKEAPEEIKEAAPSSGGAQEASPTSPVGVESKPGIFKRILSRTPSQRRKEPEQGCISSTQATER